MHIGNYIGAFLSSDPNNFSGGWKAFLRIRVLMDVRLPLKRRMKLRKLGGEWIWVTFKYEKLPTFCFICGIIGHADSSCEKLYDAQGREIERPYGLFLKAPSRNVSASDGERWLCSSSAEDSSSKYGKDVNDAINEEISMQEGENRSAVIKGKGVNHESASTNPIPKKLPPLMPKFKENPLFIKTHAEYMQGMDNTNNLSLVVMDQKRRRTDPRHSGGLALLWKEQNMASLIRLSRFHIEVEVTIYDQPKWRLTGYYGTPNRNKHRESWDLLRRLTSSSTLPWVVLGDFNDLLFQHEKMGQHQHPSWLLNGIKEAIEDCQISDLGMDGYQFTWCKSRGSPGWIEERLDRAFTSSNWTEVFPGAKVNNLGFFSSDHAPIFLQPVAVIPWQSTRRFRFENMWLREEDCKQVIYSSWDKSVGEPLLNRIKDRGEDLLCWGGSGLRKLNVKIRQCRALIIRLQSRTDSDDEPGQAASDHGFVTSDPIPEAKEATVVANTKIFLHQWREAHQPATTPNRNPQTLDFVQWHPPVAGSLKINIDAAIFENQERAGLGLVIRDDRGSFIAAKVIPVRGITDPLIAEVLGVREALSWLKVRFPEVQIIEMDALLVYNALQQNKVDNSYFGLLIEDCRLLASDMPNIKFSWVRRSANQVAHILAKAASSFHDTIEWSYFSPLFISNVLLADLINE
ncbi:unnamed protein product [Fraxinus pennsylvanica]|uniref:Uncharacterized protein n=1 Tax=Fraxinus pennsylvanica TaxID=56036 RepID=A0AAD2E5E3_9LAMI|nr:unnamed protein product [Fraxinus pennsylvanica]